MLPHSDLEVVGKTFSTDMVIAVHAYARENHNAFLVLNLKVSYVSKSQDKHDASSLFSNKSLERSTLPPLAKIENVRVKCKRITVFHAVRMAGVP